ncbi:hypothetical protein ACMDCR_05030 [Labrys okinawensis]|uniref:hypothetical protein n=1 Tax=Labrys okinawensis TaxID=346911 RepID=UPI0039BC71F7
MQTSRILQIIRSRWLGVAAFYDEAPEPLDHPSLRGMSPRELADLPLERWERVHAHPPSEAAVCEKRASRG